MANRLSNSEIIEQVVINGIRDMMQEYPVDNPRVWETIIYAAMARGSRLTLQYLADKGLLDTSISFDHEA